MSDSFIPLCVPEIRGNEWRYVKECLDTAWVSSVGSYVDRFEKMVAERAGTRFAVATVNGTSALHISLLIAGVKPDEEVLVSTLTFIAPANAIRYVGAWPVFIDAEPEYWQMDVAKVADFLENQCRWVGGELRNQTTGRRVSAIVPVHVLGHPVDMAWLQALAAKYGLRVIGDATESLGATYQQKPVGQLADLSCFSFNGNKILTTGGGGMIVTDNEEWARRAKYLTTQAKDDPVEYIHHEIGYNHRLTNLQAAMGCAQMEQLDDYIAAKRRIAARYIEAFAELDGLAPMREAAWASSVFWMFTVLLDEARYGLGWRALLAKLQERQIQTRPLWQPLHQSRAHAGSQSVGGEVAERLYATALSLPCSVGLKPEDQERVIATVRELSLRP
ncbi:MAG: perosamine synthetase [Chthoniobacter sp.]|jgi:perosamine synthetase|nr:perosamine synthetase [Chthoniobacter sp.]